MASCVNAGPLPGAQRMIRSNGGQVGGFPVERWCSFIAQCDSAMIFRSFRGRAFVHEKDLAHVRVNYYA
jgi:hypothetical protein